MDELDFKGKKYISSRRAAELTDYAKDYVGQLAREGKVLATRVGRSWFVEEEDILRHSGKLTLCEIKEAERGQNEILNALNDSYAYRSLHELKNAPPRSFATWSTIHYLQDEGDMFPEQKVKTTHIPIKKITKVPSLKSAVKKELETEIIKYKISDKRDYNENKLKTENITRLPRMNFKIITVSAGSLGLLLVFSSLSGVYISSDWVAEGTYVANAGYALEIGPVLDLFRYVFDEGVKVLVAFFTLIVDSFVLFLRSGIDYFLAIFNLN
jgi:hypothetical protein